MEVEEARRWEELAMDCLVIVLAKLSLEDRTLSVPFVCKSWYQASLHPQCWRILNFRELNLMPWSSFISRFVREYRLKTFSFSAFMKFVIERSRGSAVELAFPAVHGASLEDFVHASNKCPRVRTLVLPNLPQQHERHIPGLIGKWKDLEQLEMGLKFPSFSEILKQVSLNCKNFVGLKMCGWFNNEDAKAIVMHLPKLKYLAISWSFLHREQLMMILDGCKELEAVELATCRGFDVDDEIKKAASGIKSFKCSSTKVYEDYWDDCGEIDDMFWARNFGY